MSDIENNTDSLPVEKPLFAESAPEQLADAQRLAARIAAVLDDKKARSVKVIGISRQTIIADYFVIATGTSSTHIRALAGEVEFQLSAEGRSPSRVSGANGGEWAVIDFDSVIVHIFNEEARGFYRLEKLWGGGDVDAEKLMELVDEG
jgi:ribosome-associated protein